jgi:hypothetical protein
MKKLTAVEWLHYKIMNPTSHEPVDNINLWFLKAKEMEKEQIIEAHGKQLKKTQTAANYEYWKTGEQYYKENYEKK